MDIIENRRVLLFTQIARNLTRRQCTVIQRNRSNIPVKIKIVRGIVPILFTYSDRVWCILEMNLGSSYRGLSQIGRRNVTLVIGEWLGNTIVVYREITILYYYIDLIPLTCLYNTGRCLCMIMGSGPCIIPFKIQLVSELESW